MTDYTTRLQAVLEELQSIHDEILEANSVTVEPADTNAFKHKGIDFIVGDDREATKAAYREYYGKSPVDSDPVNGLWYSASKRFSASDLVGISVGDTPVSNSEFQTIALIPKFDDQINTSGWAQTDDGVVWTSGNRYKVNTIGNKTVGVFEFPVTLEAGAYKIQIDARAAEKTSGRTDLHNDVWFWIDDVFAIRKHYFSGKGSWVNSTTAEDSSGDHSKIQNSFTVTADGQYVLNMSGRSKGAEVRAVRIIKQ